MCIPVMVPEARSSRVEGDGVGDGESSAARHARPTAAHMRQPRPSPALRRSSCPPRRRRLCIRLVDRVRHSYPLLHCTSTSPSTIHRIANPRQSTRPWRRRLFTHLPAASTEATLDCRPSKHHHALQRYRIQGDLKNDALGASDEMGMSASYMSVLCHCWTCLGASLAVVPVQQSGNCRQSKMLEPCAGIMLDAMHTVFAENTFADSHVLM